MGNGRRYSACEPVEILTNNAVERERERVARTTRVSSAWTWRFSKRQRLKLGVDNKSISLRAMRERSTTRRRMGALTCPDGCIFNGTKIAAKTRRSASLPQSRASRSGGLSAHRRQNSDSCDKNRARCKRPRRHRVPTKFRVPFFPTMCFVRIHHGPSKWSPAECKVSLSAPVTPR